MRRGWLIFAQALLATIMSLAFLIGCAPSFTASPVSATGSPLLPTVSVVPRTATLKRLTLTPITPSATATIPATRTPTPTPTTAPYYKVPKKLNDGWLTASLSDVGIDPVKIKQMLGFIYRGGKNGDKLRRSNGTLKFQKIHSILIVKDDRLVFEEYFYDYSLGNRHDLASVTKSITSLLVGLAIEQGYIEGVDEKVLSYFPEYLPLRQPDERKDGITIEDLLTMRHGLACDDWDPTSVAYHKTNFYTDQPDLVKATLNLPVEVSPGSQFSYCSASTVVLGAILTKATGMSIAEFAKRYLFAPLGLDITRWGSLLGGWTDTGGDLQMSPRDMARLGLLMLHNGNWNGEQIIPEDWIHQSIQEHVSLEFNQTWGKNYGYLWWLSDVPIAGTNVHSFAASGAGGQVIAIFPDLDMVIVITGGNYDNDEGQPFQIMQRFILPAVLAP